MAHLLLAGEEEHARQLLFDARWLVERRGDGTGIIEDCRRFASDDRAVQLVGQAVDMSMHELRLDPRRLCGQLVGRLMGSENSVREIGKLLRQLRNGDWGFDWCCPVSRTLDQAGDALLRIMAGHTGRCLGGAGADGSRVVSDLMTRRCACGTPRPVSRTLEGHRYGDSVALARAGLGWCPDL